MSERSEKENGNLLRLRLPSSAGFFFFFFLLLLHFLLLLLHHHHHLLSFIRWLLFVPLRVCQPAGPVSCYSSFVRDCYPLSLSFSFSSSLSLSFSSLYPLIGTPRGEDNDGKRRRRRFGNVFLWRSMCRSVGLAPRRENVIIFLFLIFFILGFRDPVRSCSSILFSLSLSLLLSFFNFFLEMMFFFIRDFNDKKTNKTKQNKEKRTEWQHRTLIFRAKCATANLPSSFCRRRRRCCCCCCCLLGFTGFDIGGFAVGLWMITEFYRVFFFPSIRTAAWKMHVMAGRTCGSHAVNKTKQNKKITRGASFFFFWWPFFLWNSMPVLDSFFFRNKRIWKRWPQSSGRPTKKKERRRQCHFFGKKKEKKRKKGRRKTIRGLSGPFFLWVMRVSHKGSIATESSTSSRVKGKVVNMQMSKSIDGNWWAKISNLVESRYDWQGFKKNPKKNNSDSWTIMDTIKS